MRTVIWVQGCTLGCPGCFNPHTHASAPAIEMQVSELVASLERASSRIEGITVSGGEPFQQPAALLELVRAVRIGTGLSIVLFSGYKLEEIRRMPLGPAILEYADVLIDGRYVRARRLARRLRGSANQKIHLLTDRYAMAEIEAAVPLEIRIDPRGNVIYTGIKPLDGRG